MYEPDRFLTACMPLIPMLAALHIMLEIWKMFKEWAKFTMNEHESMKKKLADIEQQNLDLKEEQLGEMHDKVVELQNELDALQQSAPRTRRGQSPARHRGKSPGGRG